MSLEMGVAGPSFLHTYLVNFHFGKVWGELTQVIDVEDNVPGGIAEDMRE
jgi:hypothetical protein